jgi:hypothetical protein
MKRSGYADLPLHRGHVPSWLATRMTMLGTAIIEAVLDEYGRSEVLRKRNKNSDQVRVMGFRLR